jgi:hypothetical protein
MLGGVGGVVDTTLRSLVALNKTQTRRGQHGAASSRGTGCVTARTAVVSGMVDPDDSPQTAQPSPGVVPLCCVAVKRTVR